MSRVSTGEVSPGESSYKPGLSAVNLASRPSVLPLQHGNWKNKKSESYLEFYVEDWPDK